MIRLKTEHDIKYIKKAIKIGEDILDKLDRCIIPGVTTEGIAKNIGSMIFWRGVKSSFLNYKGFPSVACISVNEDIIHGIPNYRGLKKGDIVKIDLGINYKGYYSDQARTYIVNESPSRDVDAIILKEATSEALFRAIHVAKEGNTIGDISREIENTAKEFKVGILKDYTGHGVGFEVHEEPRVPNRIGADKDVKLVKGMVLALEPMFVFNGKGNYTIAKDGWTVEADGIGSHFEKTIII